MTKTIAKKTTLFVVIIVINAFSIRSENMSRPEFYVNDKNCSTVFPSSIFPDQYVLLPDDSMNLDGDLRLGVLGNTIPLAKTLPTLSADPLDASDEAQRNGAKVRLAGKFFQKTPTIKVNSINHDA